jgi:hypothetical protein
MSDLERAPLETHVQGLRKQREWRIAATILLLLLIMLAGHANHGRRSAVIPAGPPNCNVTARSLAPNAFAGAQRRTVPTGARKEMPQTIRQQVRGCGDHRAPLLQKGSTSTPLRQRYFRMIPPMEKLTSQLFTVVKVYYKGQSVPCRPSARSLVFTFHRPRALG